MYSVEPYPEAAAAIAALPEEAHWEDAVKFLQLMPWRGDPYVASKPDGNMRSLVFGAGGNGMLTYLILEEEQQVHVLRVQWAG